MSRTKHWARAGVLLALPIAACSTIVGADFDDLAPVGTAGTSAGSGGGGSAGVSNGGAGGGQDLPLLGGAGAGGEIEGGASQGGAPTGGVAGEPSGGAAEAGGAPSGGAGSAGEPSGGAGGSPDTTVPPTDVVLNELKGQGSGDDYIELYNPGTQAADIGGCYVVDDSNNRVTFPLGATIAPKGYVLVRLQQLVSTGMVTTCFGFSPCYDGLLWGISAKGEVIFLHDAQGVRLDDLTYPSEDGANNVGNGNSLGRIPDGAATTGRVPVSPGTANMAVP
ncbi:MAG: putative secreted protein [Polyangiaceae bacterium]|jgi:hypothetical protein|nr:putative secreted protein [Polyangiaceae bacterium]